MEQVIVQKKGSEAPLGGGAPVFPEDKLSPKPGMKEEKNSLDEGEAVLIWPENLSPASVRDLEYWLNGVLKKAKRRAAVHTPDMRQRLIDAIKANMIASGLSPGSVTDEAVARIVDLIE